MIIWSGWGFLVALIWAIAVGAMSSMTDAMITSPVLLMGTVLACSILTSAVIWGLAKAIRHLTLRELVDPRTGAIVQFDGTGSLFFIPMRFWVYLIPVINLTLYWMRLTP